MLELGCDPGRTGGALLCKGRAALAALHWRTYTQDGRRLYDLRVARASTSTPSVRRGMRTAHDLGMGIRAMLSPLVLTNGGTVRVACEGAHVGRNAQSALKTSRFAGALVGPLEAWDPAGEAEWVEPDQWRKLSFRSHWWKLQAEGAGQEASRATAAKLGRTFMQKREAAKRESQLAMPPLVSGLAPLLLQLGTGEEHVCDAAGVWRWLVLQ